MKYLLLLLSLFPITVNAGEIQAKVFTHNFMTDDEIYQRGVSAGVQLSYMFNDSAYVFISNESVGVRPKVKAYTYTLNGVGFGSKYKLTKHIKLFGQLGYFQVKNDWGDQPNNHRNEGLAYYINDRYDTYLPSRVPHSFDGYSVHNDNTFAGELGLELDYPVTKNFSFVSSFSMRIMKISEEIHAYVDSWDYKNTGVDWEFQANRNYSSLSFALGVNYRF